MASSSTTARALTALSASSSWNSNIRAAVTNARHRDALLLYRHMKQSNVPPDHLTFPLLAKAAAHLLRSPEPIHTHVLKSPFSSHVFVATALIDAYVKCHHLNSAHKLFERMPRRDAAAWNVIITGFSRLDSLNNALTLFRRMRAAEIRPDAITLISLAQACACNRNLRAARAVHCLGFRTGLNADVSVANTWISAYAKCEDLAMAELVFDSISADTRTVVSWNSMIAGYALVGRSSEVSALFGRMMRDDIRPDLSTVLSLLSSFAHAEAILEGKLIHCLAFKAGFGSDVSVTNTLISLYSKCGNVDAARYCFDSMLERTCVSWTAMIGGYAKVGDIGGAVDLFRSMEADGERPDAVTVVALLSACSQAGALEIGRSMNWYAVANGLEDNVVVRNAIVDMYAKCGSIAGAQRLFDSMRVRTTVSWTSMITGYAMNGQFEDSVDLFSQMLESGLRPNHVTFLAVLQACTHGGFLEKGWEYFDVMRKVYHIHPRLEHYACMVHLLGGQAKLKEALELIRSMPMEPDAGVWGALLGACLTHHETEVGEYAATHLFKLQPQAAVSYVAMANIYAAAERWDGVAKIRAMMKQKGVSKKPGQSAVQVNGRIHSFTVDDKIHPESLDVYGALDGLALHLKDVDHLDDSRQLLQ